MALTQISTAGVKDDAVTAGKIPADAVGSSEIAANAVGSSELADNAVDNAAVASNAAIAGTKISPDFGSQAITTTGTLNVGNNTNLTGINPRINFVDSTDNPDYKIQLDSGRLAFRDVTNTTDRIVIESDGHVDVTGNLDVGAGIDVTGTLTTTSHVFLTTDNTSIRIGADADLQMWHDGSNGYLSSYTGKLNLYVSGEKALVANQNGAVEAYYDNSKKLETSSNGIDVTGNANLTGWLTIDDNQKAVFGDGHDLQIYHDGSSTSHVAEGTGNLRISVAGGSNQIQLTKGTAPTENIAKFIADGAVELYHNNVKKFETTSDGGTVTGELDVFKSGVGDVFHVQGNGTGAVVAKIENAYNSDNDRFAILELKSGKGAIRFNSNGDSNEGAITYETATNAMIFGVNNASEKLRIQANGGISFNGDTAAANALDDYEEGTFTPVLKGTDGGGTLTGSSSAGGGGNYTKIGNKVHFSFYFANPTGSNPAGTLYFEMPFSAASGNAYNGAGGCVTYTRNIDPSSNRIFAVNAINGTNRLYLTRVKMGGEGETSYQTISNDSNLSSMLFKATVTFVAA